MTAPLPVPSRRAGFVVVACLLAAGLAQGADKPAPKTPILTPAQLRECLAQKDRLHAQTEDALKDKAAIEADKAEIERSGSALGGEVTTLDRTSASAVEAYNGKVGERDKLIEGFQAKVAAYNLKAVAVQSTKAAYEKTCEARRYDERDLPATKSKK
jgi:hypothetical protein